MLGFLRSDASKVFRKAKRKGMTHFEKEHQTRAMLYFKRAAAACPGRAVEFAQFYYDRHDYKRACFFYDRRLKAGGASQKTYKYAVRAYEKRGFIYGEQKNYAKENSCRAQAKAYRASISKFFGPPPLPVGLLEAP